LADPATSTVSVNENVTSSVSRASSTLRRKAASSVLELVSTARSIHRRPSGSSSIAR
jgi:hypothetical protein